MSEKNQNSEDDVIKLAGAMYPSGQRKSSILWEFASELAGQGWRVGGIVQEILYDGDGHKSGIDAVEIDTGHRIPINRPTDSDRMHKTCSLDPAALAESGGAIDRAVREHMDLIIVEKFGEQEQEGNGMANDILRAISEGIPTLVAVPDGVRSVWQDFTGNLGEEIACEPMDLRAWWSTIQPK